MTLRLFIFVPVACLLLVAGLWNPPRDLTAYDSERWIDDGFTREGAGDLPGAERDFLQAASLDKLYLPAWTLAGFYFRRGDQAKFWLWARKGLSVGERDLGALFDLCWKMPGGGERIWTDAMPPTKATWDEYLSFLMTSDRWPAASATAARVAAVADAHDRTILLNYCDLALAHGDRAGAATVWRALEARGLLPYRLALLTNGNFEVAPTGHGFDWRVPPADGLTSSFHHELAAFTLSGYQPERCVLIEQPLALAAEMTYKLRFEYKTDSASGLRWQAGDAIGPLTAASGWSRAEFEFSGAAKSLALLYRRPEGETNAEGTVSLRRLEVAPR